VLRAAGFASPAAQSTDLGGSLEAKIATNEVDRDVAQRRWKAWQKGGDSARARARASERERGVETDEVQVNFGLHQKFV
jgi:hypothetical protein